MKEATVLDLVRCQKRAGEVGIEVELEGNGVGAIQDNRFWRTELDGSLRGESVELVLRKPAPRHLVPNRLRGLEDMVWGCRLHDSGRAGIHIHVNVQELTPREYVQFVVLFLALEEALVSWCGEGRVGNLFCLRSSDAAFGLQLIRDAIQWWDFRRLDNDDIRYASVNLKATAKYGSLEFRPLRSTSDTRVIQKWIDILLRIKDESRKYASPPDIIEDVSRLGVEGFFEKILGGFDIPRDRQQIMSGVRNAQFLAYCRNDWSCLVPE